jgi:hypothetical protein
MNKIRGQNKKIQVPHMTKEKKEKKRKERKNRVIIISPDSLDA